MMFSNDKMKQLLDEAYQAGLDSDYAFLNKIDEIMELLQSTEDIENFAKYMEDMTYKEYFIFTGFVDDIDGKYVTKNFVEALKNLLQKYQVDIPVEKRESEIETKMLRYFEKELANREKEKN